MAGLVHLKEALDTQGKEFVNNLLNKTVIINEKMAGTFFGVRKDPDSKKFKFFKRNSNISYVDRVLSLYFEPPIEYFETKGSALLDQMPPDYLFGMEYFSDKKSQSIEYDRLPKNNLILNYIHILNKAGEVIDVVQKKDELNKWANILGIEPPPIIFQGKLNDLQKKKIQEFIYTSIDELVDKFKTTSFTRYIISILNPSLEATFLRDSLEKDIDGIVFRFYDDDTNNIEPVFLAKLVDPVFLNNARSRTVDEKKKSDDYIWIMVIDLMNFIEQYTISDLRDIPITGEKYDHRYVTLVNHIYLEFINEFGEKYRDLDIQIPEFLQRNEFNVNYNLVNNVRVTSMIESNSNFKEIYRVFINMFRKKKVKVNSTFFTKEMKDNLNDQIDKISKVIMGDSIYENYFPTFNEFVGEDKEPGYFESFKKIDNRRTKPVNLIISDFQPIHPGHIKSAQSLFDENGLPCLLVCIHTGDTTRTKPFKKETVANGLQKLESTHPSIIAGHVIVSDGEVETLLRTIRTEYEPNIIAANRSRIRDLALQLELARKRSRNLNLKKELRLMELPFAGVKDTIMNTIKNNDYASFKSAAPQEIHSEFHNMNRDVTEKLNESLSKTTTINESKIPETPIIIEDEVLEVHLTKTNLQGYAGSSGVIGHASWAGKSLENK